jgi:hypothetical protein
MSGRRWLGWGLIAYGVVGVAMIVAGTLIGLEMADRLERLATDADEAIVAAAEATRAAAGSFDGVDDSLAGAGDSTAAAASLARQSQQTLDNLADAMSVSILGAQPLLPLAADFAESAELAAELAETLDGVQATLGDTRSDVAAIGAELEALATELEDLGGTTRPESGSPPVRLFVGLLLVWLGVQVVAAIVGGIALLVTDRRETVRSAPSA